MQYATITQLLGGQVKLKLNTDSTESNMPYYHLDSYNPSIGDIVLVDTRLHCVLGKVVTDGVSTAKALEQRLDVLEAISL